MTARTVRMLPWRAGAVFPVIGWLVFLILCWGPFVTLLSSAFSALATGDAPTWALLNITPRRTTLFGRSLMFSLGVTGLATLVGSLAALGFLRLAAGRTLSGGLRSILISALAVWAIAPAYLHALGGMEAGYVLNGMLRAAGSGTRLPEIQGWIAVLLIETLALLPFPIIGALIGFLGAERDRIEAGILLARDGTVFRRIALPLARPALIAGAGAVFVLSLIDANTPSLFGLSSYAMEIAAEYSASHQPARAALLALPLILAAALVLSLVLVSLGRSRSAHGQSFSLSLAGFRPIDPTPSIAYAGLGVALVYALMVLLLLLGGLSLWQDLLALVWSVRNDIAVTLGNALLAGLIALLPATAVAATLASSRHGPLANAALWALALLPLALPPSLTGIGITSFMTDHAPVPLRTLAFLPGIAHVARFMPLAVLLIWARMRRLDPLLIDAARLQRPPGLFRFARIDLPLLAPGLAAAFALVFCGSIGELEAALLTAAPGAGLLSMRVFNYLHYGASDTVAALGLVLVAIVWAGVLTGLRLMETGSAKGGRS